MGFSGVGSRARLGVAFAVMVFALVACSQGAGLPAGAGPSDPAPAVAAITAPALVLADSQAGLEGATLKQLKVAAVRNLWVRAKVLDVRDLSALTVSFTGPKGDVFHEERFLFSTNVDRKTIYAAAGHPVDVRHPTPIAGGFALDAMIPIGGTNFERYSVAGAWTATVTVERAGHDHLSLSQPFDLDVHL